MKRLLPLLILLTVLAGLTACQPEPASPENTLQVFAAASLTESFTKIGADFERTNRGTAVVFNFSGSQQLVQQMAQGAQADVFASADLRQMEQAVEAGLVVSGTAVTFASNRLAVVLAPGNPGGIEDLAYLSQPGKRLVLASPEAPAGLYTQEFLLRMAGHPAFGPWYWEAVLANVVSYEPNVKAVFTKVRLGEADAGIVYASDLVAGDVPEAEGFLAPPEVSVRIHYPAAVLQASPRPELAQRFIDYLLSPAGQKILGEYGLLPPP